MTSHTAPTGTDPIIYDAARSHYLAYLERANAYARPGTPHNPRKLTLDGMPARERALIEWCQQSNDRLDAAAPWPADDAPDRAALMRAARVARRAIRADEERAFALMYLGVTA